MFETNAYKIASLQLRTVKTFKKGVLLRKTDKRLFPSFINGIRKDGPRIQIKESITTVQNFSSL